jgi:hypothetical protein
MRVGADECRDGFLCRAELDTASLRSGAMTALHCHLGCWPGRNHRGQLRADAVRFQGDGLTRRWTPRTLGAVGSPLSTTSGPRVA